MKRGGLNIIFILTIVFAVLFSLSFVSATLTTPWSKTAGHTTDDRGLSVAIGSDGSRIVGGYFQGNVSFGGPILRSNAYSWIDNANVKDAYIAKYDSSGIYVWSKQLGGISDYAINVLAIDGQNNVIVTGYVGGSVDFGNGAVTTSAGGKDMFVAKYSGSDGSHIWSKRFGGIYDDYGYGLAVDSNNDLIITGQFMEQINFGGGLLVSAGGGDMYAVKLSGVNGNHIWSKRFGNVNTDYGYGVDVDGSNNPVFGGRFAATIDLGGA